MKKKILILIVSIILYFIGIFIYLSIPIDGILKYMIIYAYALINFIIIEIIIKEE